MVQSKPHIISRKEKNCYLLVNRENGAVLVTNSLGMEIWNQMSKKQRMVDIVKKLMERYGVEFEESKAETVKFVDELLKNDFVLLDKH